MADIEEGPLKREIRPCAFWEHPPEVGMTLDCPVIVKELRLEDAIVVVESAMGQPVKMHMPLSCVCPLGGYAMHTGAGGAIEVENLATVPPEPCRGPDDLRPISNELWWIHPDGDYGTRLDASVVDGRMISQAWFRGIGVVEIVPILDENGSIVMFDWRYVVNIDYREEGLPDAPFVEATEVGAAFPAAARLQPLLGDRLLLDVNPEGRIRVSPDHILFELLPKVPMIAELRRAFEVHSAAGSVGADNGGSAAEAEGAGASETSAPTPSVDPNIAAQAPVGPDGGPIL